jgi:hypothetical protein
VDGSWCGKVKDLGGRLRGEACSLALPTLMLVKRLGIISSSWRGCPFSRPFRTSHSEVVRVPSFLLLEDANLIDRDAPLANLNNERP